ncbi:MAG: TatD family hydrolase [Saprospiraceae bacterium]|uniref:TatD family hydrolase n=1 Tax=Candidatus Defluviibacterium haderslevense TaxID=2981993 RepID=A0A9D7XFC8_9BACT|nr:TatD family hydrolase [Candidatus Defluviibacterium haderslevense]
MNWIDTHTHLYLEEFKLDLDQVIQRATENGLVNVLLPNIDVSTIPEVDAMCQDYPEIARGMMGLHPCSVNENYLHDLDIIGKKLYSSTYIGVGEVGLDLYWDKTNFEIQKQAFITQINWAKELKLPLSIHTREATTEALQIIETLQDGSVKGVFHCFGGSVEEARRVSDLGMYLGLGGVTTYKKSNLPDILNQFGLDRIVLETDAPYLTPVPHRGKRNESAYIPIIGARIAEILNVDIREVSLITTKNAKEVFKL